MKNSSKVMQHKGFKAKIMEAERLVGEDTHELPPGNALDVYPVDIFKDCPENWMKGPGVFVVPVRPNKGLWFDWRDNDELNTAVIPTVKGCNPITGMQTTGFHLERYEDKCPKHGCKFEALRYCPECGYKWPDRGYVSGSPLWWDGWMSEGAIRQFFFTEEMMRDVATHMIGKENTVPAFGFAFYSPKERRVPSIQHTYQANLNPMGYAMTSGGFGAIGAPKLFSSSTFKGINLFSSSSSLKKEHIVGSSLDALHTVRGSSKTRSRSVNLDSVQFDSLAPDSSPSDADMECVQERDFTPQKEVAIGAGAKIRQSLPTDSYSLDSWKDTPDSVMTIYFVFQEEFDRMAAGGFKDFSDCKDGMLNGLPVG